MYGKTRDGKSALKSDHFGIEIEWRAIFSYVVAIVKIRPFWD